MTKKQFERARNDSLKLTKSGDLMVQSLFRFDSVKLPAGVEIMFPARMHRKRKPLVVSVESWLADRNIVGGSVAEYVSGRCEWTSGSAEPVKVTAPEPVKVKRSRKSKAAEPVASGDLYGRKWKADLFDMLTTIQS